MCTPDNAPHEIVCICLYRTMSSSHPPVMAPSISCGSAPKRLESQHQIHRDMKVLALKERMSDTIRRRYECPVICKSSFLPICNRDIKSYLDTHSTGSTVRVQPQGLRLSPLHARFGVSHSLPLHAYLGTIRTDVMPEQDSAETSAVRARSREQKSLPLSSLSWCTKST